MYNFKQIDKCDVWPHLIAGKKVFAIILKSQTYRAGVKELWHGNWDVRDINKILSDEEKDIIFFEEIEKEV